MAFKLWCEDISEDDCIQPGEWNKMTEYIKHSAVTDFTIYGTEADCTDTGQAFLFSQAGIESLMYGGADSGDVLTIFANSAEPCPSISLIGSQGIINRVAYDDQFEVATCSDETLLMVSAGGFSFKGVDVCLAPCGVCPTSGDLPFTLFNDCATQDEQGFLFSISGSVSTMEGSDDASDDLILKANSNDTYPFIELFGDSDIELCLPNGRIIYFLEGDREFFSFSSGANLSILEGGKVTGDDLHIRANSFDDCPSITMSGNLSMHCNISDAGIFEVSTCSDEQLFTVDVTTTDNHVDFHCLDAHNFCLEIRTSDPPSPTCTGQLWFRIDLA